MNGHGRKEARMSNTTITLTGEGLQELHALNLHISVEALVNVDAKRVRRQVTAC
jgi:hypothetical protein